VGIHSLADVVSEAGRYDERDSKGEVRGLREVPVAQRGTGISDFLRVLSMDGKAQDRRTS
jgi:hypothetical protein